MLSTSYLPTTLNILLIAHHVGQQCLHKAQLAKYLHSLSTAVKHGQKWAMPAYCNDIKMTGLPTRFYPWSSRPPIDPNFSYHANNSIAWTGWWRWGTHLEQVTIPSPMRQRFEERNAWAGWSDLRRGTQSHAWSCRSEQRNWTLKLQCWDAYLCRSKFYYFSNLNWNTPCLKPHSDSPYYKSTNLLTYFFATHSL